MCLVSGFLGRVSLSSSFFVGGSFLSSGFILFRVRFGYGLLGLFSDGLLHGLSFLDSLWLFVLCCFFSSSSLFLGGSLLDCCRNAEARF